MDRVAAFFDGCKEEYEKGNKWALMQAILVCAMENIPLPKWTAQAYELAYDAVRTGKAKSWDDVFDKPYPPSTHLNKVAKRCEILWPLYQRVQEIISKSPGRPVDVSLFEEVAREFCIGKTQASEYYYEAKQINKSLGLE